MKTKQNEAKNGQAPTYVTVKYTPSAQVLARLERLSGATGRSVEDLAAECVAGGLAQVERTTEVTRYYRLEPAMRGQAEAKARALGLDLEGYLKRLIADDLANRTLRPPAA